MATTAGRLPAKRVIHTVGPVWQTGEQGEPALLTQAYRSSLVLAREEGLRTVAFPSISTGAYGYPMDKGAVVAVGAVRDELLACPEAFDEIRFVLFDTRTLRAFEAALAALGD